MPFGISLTQLTPHSCAFCYFSEGGCNGCDPIYCMRAHARVTTFAPFGDLQPEREAELHLATWL